MRDIPVGNGSLLVNFDDKYQIRDIYFPRVGQENHTEGFPCRFGVWADGDFSWVASDGWKRELRYLPETLVTDVLLTNEKLGVKIRSNDTVASHDNTFLRRVRVKNLRQNKTEFRVFLHHDLRIYENNFGDTALLDPDTQAIVHYKKHRYFLINTEPPFDTFATGRKAFQGKEGTWRDAEDGNLQGGSITEGSVDSTIGMHFSLEPDASFEFYYWIAAGTSYEEVAKLNALITESRPQIYLDYTANYWRAWVNKNETDLDGIPEDVVELYKRSLLIVNTQIDSDGAILAANDYDVTERATDHYSYLWTRDGAFIAHALDLAGYSHLTRKFFTFCGRIVHKDGYFLQKYNADGTVASGWHASWDVAKKEKLVPIQEDETALVLWALWEHYERYRDIEFAHRSYRRITVPCADFIVKFRDPETGLPLPSWNLWEDRHGVHTFTCATVVAGLRAAANFAALFAEYDRGIAYQKAADEVRDAMKEHLYSSELGRFLRSLQSTGDGRLVPDTNIDASLFATFYFGCFPAEDEMVVNTMNAIKQNLSVDGGIARFQHDGYMSVSDKIIGNPWFICTLWLADYYIAIANSKEDLKAAMEVIEWVVKRALPSGVLAEQLNPITGEHVSVSPLTWSHSTFIATVANYLEKLRQF
ncbi:MAG TPA: glycoside hydrolase family 15 protein [Pyrinomonadaceae bacterium]|nr:glycoside hydrolase family 15 protein [Pyrinomonadaceae bacterium]